MPDSLLRWFGAVYIAIGIGMIYLFYVGKLVTEVRPDGIYVRFDRYGGMAMMWQKDGSDRPRDELREEIRKGWPKVPGIRHNLESAQVGGGGLSFVRASTH